MLPLVAWKGLSIGWKIGSIVGVFALLAGLWGWGWLAGRESCQEAHHAEMMAQAVNMAEHTIARSEGQELVQEQHQAIRANQEEQVRVVTKEVIRYVQHKKESCLLSPEYIALVDRLTELQSSSQSGVSEADTTAPTPETLRTATASTDQLLLAWLELSRARQRDLAALEEMQDSDAARYADEMRFWMGLPPEARGE